MINWNVSFALDAQARVQNLTFNLDKDFLDNTLQATTDNGSQKMKVRDILTREVQLAGQQWAQYLNGPDQVNINVQVIINPRILTLSVDDDHVFSFLDTNSYGHDNVVSTGTVDSTSGKTVAENYATHKLRVNKNESGSSPDIRININPTFWLSSAHDLTTTRSATINPGQMDAVSAFMHEIGHAIAFNGFDYPNNSQAGSYESPFDKYIVHLNGSEYFAGPKAESLYGGRPVPLTAGYHVTGPSLTNDLLYEANGASSGLYGQHKVISPLDLAILADCLNFNGMKEPPAFQVNAAPPSPNVGFNGDQVTLRVLYQPNDASSPIVTAHGTATVAPGNTTFPHVAALSTGSSLGSPKDASVTFKDSSIAINYPASEEGTPFASGPLNELVFETAPNNPPITGISLFSTNIPGLTAANVTTTAHAINVNVPGLILPTDAPAFIHLSATFGPSSGSAPPQGQPSPDGTSVNTEGPSITDAAGNVWKLNRGLVNVNGADDQTTARVIALAYKGGKIWQENADKLWWSKTAPSDQWSPPPGTPTPPEAVPLAASADGTVVTNGLQAIIDAAQNTWSIVNEQVDVNGHIDPTTKNVIELAYKGGAIWQENTDHLWWMKASPSDQWSPPPGTPTAPV